jgi:dihydrofolate reductase
MVYRQFLPLAGKLYLTRVHASFEADTFFPEIDFSQWKALTSEKVDAGGKNEFTHTYTEYVRI